MAKIMCSLSYVHNMKEYALDICQLGKLIFFWFWFNNQALYHDMHDLSAL